MPIIETERLSLRFINIYSVILRYSDLSFYSLPALHSDETSFYGTDVLKLTSCQLSYG